MDIPVPIAVKPLPNYRIWITSSDGAEGDVDFSRLAGKGVFKFWNDYRNFQRFHISVAVAIAWSEDIEVGPDATYLKLTGNSVEDVCPSVYASFCDVRI